MSARRLVVLERQAGTLADARGQVQRLRVNAPSEALTSTPPIRCTSGCTSEAETNSMDTVEALAAALLGLPPANRARLAAMLLGQLTAQAEG
jgi:hypothetical protein